MTSSCRASWKTTWLKKLGLNHLVSDRKPASTLRVCHCNTEEQGPWDTVNHRSLHVTPTSVVVVGYWELKSLSVHIRENRVGHFMTLHVRNPAVVIKDHKFKGSLDCTGKCWLKENNEGLGYNLVVSACGAPLVLCSVPRDRREGEPR